MNENPENDVDEPLIDDENSRFDDQTIGDTYRNLFAGTGLVNLTSHRSVVEIDETSNDSCAFEAFQDTTLRYRVVEILKPESEKEKTEKVHMEQELSQMSHLSLSDDDEPTVKEGVLVNESVNHSKFEKKVGQTSQKTSKIDNLNQFFPKSVFDTKKSEINRTSAPSNPVPVIDLTENGTKSENISSKSMNQCSFTKPFGKFVPKKAQAPTFLTKEEEKAVNQAFYEDKIVPDSIPIMPVMVEKSKNNQISFEKSIEIEDDVEMITHPNDFVRDQASTASKNLPIIRNSSSPTTKLGFVSAKVALERDIVRLRPSQASSKVAPFVKPIIPEKYQEKREVTPPTSKISYLNSFFVGQYETPKTARTHNVTSHTVQARNLTEFREKMKKQAPQVPFAGDFLAKNDKNTKKLDLVE